MKYALFFFILLFVQSVFATGLSKTELTIRSSVIDESPDQLRLLERLVNINSGTNNIVGVTQVGEILADQFRQLGFQTEWVNEPGYMHKAPTLIAKHNGRSGKRLLLIAHLDTVFPSNGLFRQFSMSKSFVKGPGVLDDKGGIVVLLSAIKALSAQHLLDNAAIMVVLTGDEEESGKPASISRKPLFEAAVQADAALDFESAVTLDTASVGRRGISNWLVKSHGNESHSATIFQDGVGDGAIFEIVRILNTMRSVFGITKDVTYNPGMIIGGTKIDFNALDTTGTAFGRNNVVSKTALAKGDFRYLTQKEHDHFLKKLKWIVQKHLPYTTSIVAFQDGIPAMPPTKANVRLLRQYSQVSEDLGQGKINILDPSLRGAGDISYIAFRVPANLVGLGPVGIGGHSVIEKAETASFQVQTERAALLMYRLSHDMQE